MLSYFGVFLRIQKSMTTFLNTCILVTAIGPFEAKMFFYCQVSYCLTCVGLMVGTQSLKWKLYSSCFCVVSGTARANILQADSILDHSHHSAWPGKQETSKQVFLRSTNSEPWQRRMKHEKAVSNSICTMVTWL